jgi:hypothetical protein
MEYGYLARRVIQVGASCGLLALLGSAWPGAAVQDARAQDAASTGVTGPSCVIKGTYPVPKGAQIFDSASGGRTIANFTGAFAPLRISDIPADPSAGRVRLSTSVSSRSLRIDGYVPLSSLQVFTTRDLSVVGGRIWISQAQKVKLTRASADSVTAELTVAGSQSQTVRATASCDAFALQRGTPQAMEIPGNGRGYLMKSTSIDFFDAPNGDAVFSLSMMEGTAQLFWSTESRGGFVHLTSRGDITIDAWARWRDLEPLKKGEMMDQFIPPTTQVNGAQLSLDKPPPVVRATKEIPVRARRDEKEKPIGVIEADAEIYVMETVAGWTNILPKGLWLVPPEDGGFWIPSSEAPR